MEQLRLQVNSQSFAPVDDFADEPTRTDPLAALPMRALVFGAANDAEVCS